MITEVWSRVDIAAEKPQRKGASEKEITETDIFHTHPKPEGCAYRPRDLSQHPGQLCSPIANNLLGKFQTRRAGERTLNVGSP